MQALQREEIWNSKTTFFSIYLSFLDITLFSIVRMKHFLEVLKPIQRTLDCIELLKSRPWIWSKQAVEPIALETKTD